jgi:hypothetical protein
VKDPWNKFVGDFVLFDWVFGNIYQNLLIFVMDIEPF